MSITSLKNNLLKIFNQNLTFAVLICQCAAQILEFKHKTYKVPPRLSQKCKFRLNWIKLLQLLSLHSFSNQSKSKLPRRLRKKFHLLLNQWQQALIRLLWTIISLHLLPMFINSELKCVKTMNSMENASTETSAHLPTINLRWWLKQTSQSYIRPSFAKNLVPMDIVHMAWDVNLFMISVRQLLSLINSNNPKMLQWTHRPLNWRRLLLITPLQVKLTLKLMLSNPFLKITRVL